MKGEGKGAARLQLLLSYLAGLDTNSPTAAELDNVEKLCGWLAAMEKELRSARRKPLSGEMNGALLVQHLLESGDEEAVLAVVKMEELSPEKIASLRNHMGHSMLDSALALRRREEAKCIIGKVETSALLMPGIEVDCAVARCAFEGDSEMLELALSRLIETKHRYEALELALTEAARGGWPEIVDGILTRLHPEEAHKAAVAALRGAVRGEERTAEVVPLLLALVKSNQLLARHPGFSQCILMMASRQACPEVMDLLVDKMVDEQEERVGSEGETPLIMLLEVEWPKDDFDAVVAPILDRMHPHCLAVPHGSKEETPLIMTVRNRKAKLAEILAERMAPEDLALQDADGRTALIHAVLADDVPMATMLTRYMSVGLAARDNEGKSAHDYRSRNMAHLPLEPPVKGAGM